MSPRPSREQRGKVDTVSRAIAVDVSTSSPPSGQHRRKIDPVDGAVPVQIRWNHGKHAGYAHIVDAHSVAVDEFDGADVRDRMLTLFRIRHAPPFAIAAITSKK